MFRRRKRAYESVVLILRQKDTSPNVIVSWEVAPATYPTRRQVRIRVKISRYMTWEDTTHIVIRDYNIQNVTYGYKITVTGRNIPIAITVSVYTAIVNLSSKKKLKLKL